MKPSRIRDRPCGYSGCPALVLRASTYCRHHLGVLHGGASARTYRCSAGCQAVHQRCARCRCLCGGSHQHRLRDELCYLPGAPSCWSDHHGGYQDHLEVWTRTCLLCGRSSEHLSEPPPRGAACSGCGSRLYQLERRRVVAGLSVVYRGERLTSNAEVNFGAEGAGR